MTDDTVRVRLTEAERRLGGWATVHLDLSGDRETPEGLTESRRRSVRDALTRLGAAAGTVDAVDAALATPSSLPSPRSRYLLARDGSVVVDEAVPGATGRETIEVGPLPVLAPFLATGVDEFGYLVVQASRSGGDIALHRTGAFFPASTASVEGRTDTLHKASSGGWSHRGHHEHVEELWKQTQQELSAEVDRLVREERPRLLVVAGDLRARGLLLDALAPASKAIAVEFPKDTRSDGRDGAELAAFALEQVAAVEQRDREDALDQLMSRRSQDRPTADVGLRAVVEALRQAQADTVFIDIAALEGEVLLALDDVPWLARTPDESGGAEVVGEVAAAEAVLRAALLTDARILTTTSERIGAGLAALLRWPVAVSADA